jgi:hypothetical protein
MKRLLLASSLFTVAMTFTAVQKAQAQTVVTASSFASEIDSLNNQITRLDTVTAKTTFASINSDMISVLGVTKQSIRGAATDSTRNYYINYLSVQQVPTYRQIWLLKSNLVTNQTALIGKLNDFKALIY